jgi:glyoxylase-like metal-dependent hydrolase (beta-lactamase superfamily II)
VSEPARLHILLTHLHLDHIQGLVFFAPAFNPQTEIVLWGPARPRPPCAIASPLYLGAALAGRGRLPATSPSGTAESVGDRLGAGPRRIGDPP